MNKHSIAKLLIICAIVLGASYAPFSSFGVSLGAKIAYAAMETEVWWPTEGATVSGTQPFKAIVKDTDIKNYTMHWQVDNGQLNKMEDNYADYPHKEIPVDLNGWNWQKSGKYTINFVSKDLQGKIISEKKVRIVVNAQTQSPSLPTTSDLADSNDTNPLPVTAPKPAPEPIVVDTSHEATDLTSKEVDVLWPIHNEKINNIQSFKAALEDTQLSEYTMYWKVDSGQLNVMNNSTVNGPHKEALVDLTHWNWKGIGPYTLTFIAKDMSGKEIDKKSIDIKIGNSELLVQPEVQPEPIVETPTEAQSPIPALPSNSSTEPVTLPITDQVDGSNPFSGEKFYVNPNNNAKRQALLWESSRPTDAKLMGKIASMPDAKWIGNWNADVEGDVRRYVDEATTAGGIPVMIAYNIPSRDCGSYSAGGAANAEAYKTWIRGFANGIGNRKAVVILEPDALPGISCLDQSGQQSRISLLKDAINVFKSKGNVSVYLDAGHSNWIGAEDMANRLKSAGIEYSDGFALNVSNYNRTNDQIVYGTKLSSLVGGKHFVVDTSRNGQGPLGSEWCNPEGRGLGVPATTNTGNPLVDAFMWLKNPGESDGTCNGGPSAGVWWPEYALGLAQRAEF